MDAFAGNIRRGILGSLGDLVDLIHEHDAILLDGLNGFLFDLFFVDQLRSLFFLGPLEGV